MKLNLRNRFLVPTCAAMTVAFGVYLAVTTHKAGTALEHAVFEEMELAERMASAQVSSWIEHRDQDVAGWAELPLVRLAGSGYGGEEDVNELLVTIAAHAKDYEAVHLIGADGLALASSVEGQAGRLDVSDRGYFQECKRTGEPSHSPALESKVTGEPILVVCHPVTRKDGKPTGAMVLGVVDLGHFAERIVAGIKVGETGYAYICGDDGTFLAHPNHDLILKKKVTEWDFGRELLAMKEGHLEYDFKGVRKQAVFSTEPKLGWLIAVTVDNAEIYAAAREMRLFGIILTLASVVLVGAVVFFVARSVTGPINAMIDDLNAGSQQTSAAAAQISDASQTLAMQASDQAAAVQETSASLEEMTANVNNTTASAAHCQKLMQETAKVVDYGQHLDGRPHRVHAEVSAASRRDGQDHQDHRRDRLPDQPAGPERRGRGRPGRRGGQGLRGGGRGGAQPGPARRPRRPARPAA